MAIFIFLAFSGGSVHASVNIEGLEGVLNNIASKQTNENQKPFLADRNSTEEIVDPITGSLTFKQTDIALPGKDGLDLSISRIYNSSQADGATKKATVSTTSSSYTAWSEPGWYVEVQRCFISTSTCNTFYYGPYQNETDAWLMENSVNNDTSNLSFIDIAQRYYGSILETYTTYTVNTRSVPDKHTYLHTRYDLGLGWALAFPSVQKETHKGRTYVTFHDGSGASYQVNITPDTSDSNLINYEGKDVEFRTVATNDSLYQFNNGQVTAKFVFVSSDKRETYFGDDGRLVGVKDRFGNKITFTHTNRQVLGKTYPFISQIVDSIGRIVTFTYQNTIQKPDGEFTGEDIVVTVKDPDNAQHTVSFKYTKSRQLARFRSNGQITDTYYLPYLGEVTDRVGLKTAYYYNRVQNGMLDANEILFNFSNKNISEPNSAKMFAAILSVVRYPHSETSYWYDRTVRNLGPDGATQAHRVTERYDRIKRYDTSSGTYTHMGNDPTKISTVNDPNADKINYVTYEYTNDYTGYPTYASTEVMPDSYTFSSKFKLSSGQNVKQTYNKQMQMLEAEVTTSDNEKKRVTYQEFDAVFKSKPTKLKTEDITSDGVSHNTLYADRIYTSWGGLQSITQPLTEEQYQNTSIKSLYTTTFMYEPTYKMIAQKKWYQNATTLLTESFTYDNLGRIKSYINPENETTQYTYTQASDGNRVEVTKPLENNKQAKSITLYGSSGKNAFPTKTTEYYTDSNNNLIESHSTKTYDLLLGLVHTDTDTDGATTTYNFDNQGRAISVDMPVYTGEDGKTYSMKQKYEYIPYSAYSDYENSNKQITGTQVKSYVEIQNLVDMTSTEFDKQYQFYDAFGNPRRILIYDDANGWLPTDYRYDRVNRPNYIRDPEGNVTISSYDSWGEIAENIDSYGNLRRSEYDIETRKRSSYFVAANSVSNFRNLPQDSLKENIQVSLTDQWGNIVQESTFPNGTTTSGALNQYYTYDIGGNVISVTDAKEYTTDFVYDKLDRLVSVTDPLQQTTEYDYNLLGELSGIKQGGIWTKTKTFDESGRLITKTNASNESEQFIPDELGNLIAKTDINQKVFSYQYDTNNRINGEQVGAEEIRTYYNTPFGPGTLEWYEDDILKQTLSLSYTNFGQLNAQSLLYESYNHSYTNLNDKLGRTTVVQDSFSGFTRYYYDKERLKRVQTNGSNQQYSNSSEFAEYDYYADGKVKSVTYPKLTDGTYLKTEYEYNKLNQLSTVTNKKGNTTLSRYFYMYDNNGNTISVTDNFGTTEYGYDELNQLTNIVRPNGDTVEYKYDTYGNRYEEVSFAVSTPMELDDVAYSFDEWNRLTSAQIGTETTNIEYGLDGLRIKKMNDSEVTRYHYNENGQVIAESDDTNVLKAQYVRGPDRLLAKLDNSTNQTYYYLYNGHGDVVQIVDTSGNVVNNYMYDEWGNITTQTEGVTNSFKYAGEMHDEESGLYYLRARYYDPSLGRFISKDTYEGELANPLTLNSYIYAYNNPLKYIDPSGNIGWNQIDNLLGGMLASVGDTFKDLIKSPGALFQLGNAIISGDISFADLGKAIGASAIDPIWYLTNNSKHVWGGKPTDAEVKEYGRQLGNVLQLAMGSSAAMKIIAKAVPKLSKALQSIKNATSCNCFTAGTKIQTDEGEKNIEDIEVGDKVLSKDEVTGEIAYKEVTHLYRNEKEITYTLTVGDQIIETTANHPFWVDGKGWIYAVNLKLGDRLVQSDGNYMEISDIEIVFHDEKINVYNFTVADFHTYFVSSLGIWVHNISCAEIKWKGFKQGSLSEHYDKHKKEFGDITQAEYYKRAKGFSAETNASFKEEIVGNFIVKYDPATNRVLIGHIKDREIRTFYIASEANPFEAAKNRARYKSGI